MFLVGGAQAWGVMCVCVHVYMRSCVHEHHGDAIMISTITLPSHTIHPGAFFRGTATPAATLTTPLHKQQR